MIGISPRDLAPRQHHSRTSLRRAAQATTAALLMTVPFGCGRHHDSPKSAPAPSPEQPALEFTDTATKQWWLEKTVRLLRNGQSLTGAQERAQLMAKPAAEVVQELVQDEAFYDVMVDFNLFYLGLKSDKLGYPRPGNVEFVDQTVIDRPQALEGALRLKENADYFGMFAPNVRQFVAPLPQLFDNDSMSIRMDSSTYRATTYAHTLAHLDAVVKSLTSGKTLDKASFCDIDGKSINEISFSLGLPQQISDSLFAEGSPFTVFFACFSTPFTLPQDALPKVQALRTLLADDFAYMATLEPAAYMPTKLAEIRQLDTQRLHLKDRDAKDARDLSWFWQSLPNSSTNGNRKRANYMLKRFFCDDLTPVNVVAPASHAEKGRHATDPSCQACHYKLDPMAGFFRYYGEQGSYFKTQTNIRFDDQAEKPVTDYAATWQTPNAAHQWDIGYVRSTTQDELNDYSDHPEDPDLPDLLSMLKRAPEVKQCLVRRLFEYFVGDKQAVDGSYLEELTAHFNATYATSSDQAFKDTVSKLILSTTFRTPDPLSEECYDYAAGMQASDRPPCKIAFVLEKNCAACHRGASAGGKLDLTRWVSLPSGGMGFPHLDESGTQLAASASFKRIIDRLGSTDPALRMPLNKFFAVADRDALFLWLTNALTTETK